MLRANVWRILRRQRVAAMHGAAAIFFGSFAIAAKIAAAAPFCRNFRGHKRDCLDSEDRRCDVIPDVLTVSMWLAKN